MLQHNTQEVPMFAYDPMETIPMTNSFPIASAFETAKSSPNTAPSPIINKSTTSKTRKPDIKTSRPIVAPKDRRYHTYSGDLRIGPTSAA